MVNFGKRLRQLRLDAKMTQAELAAKLKVTKSVVSYYELQERSPSPDVLVLLAEIFRVSTDYLLGIEHKRTVDVSDLSEDDIHLLHVTIDTLRKKRSQQ